jgi:hypothetical protein
LLERAVGRLRQLCAGLLYKSYPRLARPAVNLEMEAPGARRSATPNAIWLAMLRASATSTNGTYFL